MNKSTTTEEKAGASQKSLIESTNIPPSLVRAVIKQMGGWDSFVESAEDIANHGIDGGFSGFIYCFDTEPFAKRNRAAIAQLASEQAKEFGQGVIEMIRGFGCFNRGGSLPTDEEIGSALYAGKDAGSNVLNALAWYAGEEVARAYVNMIENLA